MCVEWLGPLYVFCRNQILGIRSVAECCGDVEGGGYVCGAIELVVGVDGEGRRVVGRRVVGWGRGG